MSNLKRIRKEKGLSQSQLANYSNVHISIIQTYEQGVRDINKAQADNLYKLANALNCAIEDLLEIEKIDI